VEEGQGLVRLRGGCFLALRGKCEGPLILASTRYSSTIRPRHNRSPTVFGAIDFSVASYFQTPSPVVNSRLLLQGGPKNSTVYGVMILQPYITESCGFQQNVLKEILYMTKVTV